MEPTPDIKNPWLNVTRRLQSMGCNQRGYAAITITVMVDANGLPICWTTPKMTTLEPKTAMKEFLKVLESINTGGS